ncbi:MAG: DNA alkylation repair protein [Bacteroidetes bacterium]|nr:DNA alkylation repair protein [Bacteroidota bacterium]
MMAEPLKNLYNETFFKDLSRKLKTEIPDFNEVDFQQKIFDSEWENRELKNRMRHIVLTLNDTIDLSYNEAIELFKKMIYGGNGLGLEYMLFSDFVEVFGLNNLASSLDALEFFTEWASAEFAIRPFIKNYETETMNQMNEWSKHENHHLRRLASEGCRPRLPWAMALPKYKKDPSPILPILERLKNDESEYVRRSVANNLNDISKDNPKLVLNIAKKWLGKTPETDWVVKHGLRTLLKQGETEALVLFGFDNPENIKIRNLNISPNPVEIGDNLFFNFDIENSTSSVVKLRLEYAIDYVKKTGKTSRKIFKITENKYPIGITKIQRKQSFKNFSTRKHYAGAHHLTIVINGIGKSGGDFEVIG